MAFKPKLAKFFRTLYKKNHGCSLVIRVTTCSKFWEVGLEILPGKENALYTLWPGVLGKIKSLIYFFFSYYLGKMQDFRGFSLTYIIDCLITHDICAHYSYDLQFYLCWCIAHSRINAREPVLQLTQGFTTPLLSVAMKHIMQSSPPIVVKKKLHNLWGQNYQNNLVLPLILFTRASHSLWASIRSWRWGQGRWRNGAEFPALWTKRGWGHCHHIRGQQPQFWSVTQGSAAAQPRAGQT